MPKIICASAAFTKKIAVEVPTIANLQFATFLGDGSLSPRDGQNLVAGGSTFTNIGSGPVNQPSYATITPVTGSLSTGMGDGYPAWTVIMAAAPLVSAANTLLGFSNAGAVAFGTGTIAGFFNHVVNQGNVTIFNVGATATLPAPPLFPTWRLYAFVSIVGSPFTIYDLTSGTQASTSTNVATTGSRPSPGSFEIGATSPASGFTNSANVAFALGAQTGLNLTQLNAIAAALRFPLAARGITV